MRFGIRSKRMIFFKEHIIFERTVLFPRSSANANISSAHSLGRFLNIDFI